MENEYISMEDIMMIERPFDRRPVFKVSWKMTHRCPYLCPYCYMSDAVQKAKELSGEPTQSQVEEIASHIDECYDKISDGQPIQLHLIGGEPSTYDLIKVLSQIKNSNLTYVNIASNIFRPIEYWKKLKAYCRMRNIKLGVSASLHLSQLDTEEKKKEYIEKVIENNFQCKAVINPENLDLYKPFFEEFIKTNIGIELTFERDETNTCCEFSEEQIKYIDYIRDYQAERRKAKGEIEYYKVTLKNGRTCTYSSNICLINHIKEGHLDCSGFYCTAGMYNIRINRDGSMTKSACRYCSTFEKMGNILDYDSYSKVKEMIECNCHITDLKGVYKDKYCTCFNNTNMYRKGYDIKTGIYYIDK